MPSTEWASSRQLHGPLQGYQAFTSALGVLELIEARDAYLSSLCSFTISSASNFAADDAELPATPGEGAEHRGQRWHCAALVSIKPAIQFVEGCMPSVAAEASKSIGLILFNSSPEAVGLHCVGRQTCCLLQTGSLAACCLLKYDMSFAMARSSDNRLTVPQQLASALSGRVSCASHYPGPAQSVCCDRER